MELNTTTTAKPTTQTVKGRSSELVDQINLENGTSKETKKTDAEKISGDYDDFLLLLTAQMKNQDPLKPLDSTTFVSQLAQFSNVEQQVKMNTKLDNLVTSLSEDSFSEAGNYLGKYIMADGGKVQINDNDTQTSFYYKTDVSVTEAKAFITDRFGKKVNEMNLPLAPNGRSQIWELKDLDQERIESGLYHIDIKTVDSDGNMSIIKPQTRNKIVEAQKTETGFDYITNTGNHLKKEEISRLLSS
jgi:flagellar basal-body rod modification protein FlgD